MKFAKRITSIALASVTAMSLCTVQSFSEMQTMTAFAESCSDQAQYGDYLYYQMGDEDDDETYDYVTITDCDESATEIEIPDEIDGLPVKSIGEYAFLDCKYITDIIIPDSVTGLEYGAFFRCEALTGIKIPSSVTSIGTRAFYDCTALSDIIIPDSVTSVGADAFDYTSWLEASKAENPLVIVNGILIDGNTFTGDIVIPDSVTVIADGAFADSAALTCVTIPESVTNMGAGLFNGCTSLKELVFLNDIKSFEPSCIQTGENVYTYNGFFGDCTALECFTIPDGVISIGECTFNNCTSLKQINISDSVLEIKRNAFAGCEGLESVTIPDSVNEIGMEAFYLCDNLESITIENSECEIYDSRRTISNSLDYDVDDYYYYFSGIIYGYENSTTQAYAEKYDYAFESLGDAPIQTTPSVTTAVTTTTITTTTTTTTKTNVSETTQAGESTTAAPLTTTSLETTNTTNTTATTVSTFVTSAITTTATGTTRPTGDANGDDKMTVSDAAFIARMLAKRITISIDENPYADYNGDGKVTVADAAAIARYLAKAKNK